MMLNIEPNQVCTGFVRYEDGAEYEGDICDALPHGSGLLKKEGHEYADSSSMVNPRDMEYGLFQTEKQNMENGSSANSKSWEMTMNIVEIFKLVLETAIVAFALLCILNIL